MSELADIKSTASMKRVLTLHPAIRQDVIDSIIDVQNAGIEMLVTYGMRTFAEQDALFKKVPPVTKAKGGQSYHNYGLALDFCIMIDGSPSWDMKADTNGSGQSDWLDIVAIFKSRGFEWGGDWKSFKDNPHLQKLFGLTWQELLRRHNAGNVDENGFVNLEAI